MPIPLMPVCEPVACAECEPSARSTAFAALTLARSSTKARTLPPTLASASRPAKEPMPPPTCSIDAVASFHE